MEDAAEDEEDGDAVAKESRTDHGRREHINTALVSLDALYAPITIANSFIVLTLCIIQ